MGREEWMRFHRQEWGKTASHLFKARLKCHLLHETFPNSSPSCTPFTFSRSKWITLSSLSSWHVMPSFSLVFILKFSIIPTAIKLEGESTRGCSIPEVLGLLAVGQALLCYAFPSSPSVPQQLYEEPHPHCSPHPICPSRNRDTIWDCVNKHSNFQVYCEIQNFVKDYKYESVRVPSQQTLDWGRTPSRTILVRLERVKSAE